MFPLFFQKCKTKSRRIEGHSYPWEPKSSRGKSKKHEAQRIWEKIDARKTKSGDSNPTEKNNIFHFS